MSGSRLFPSPDDPHLLAEYERLERMDPLNGLTIKRRPIRDVDWGAVHRLEQVAPVWVIVPDADAAVQSRAMTQWRDRVWEDYPDSRREGDAAWCAYLFVYAEGEDRFDPRDTYQLGTAKFVWRDPVICLMAGLNADVAAIYQADDMDHKHLCRVWARHHMITSQVSRAAHGDHLHANTVPVTRVDPPEPPLPH